MSTRVGILCTLAVALVFSARTPADVGFETPGLKPLTELGTGKYKGFQGGLYPEGKNERPAAHEAAGLALGKRIQPLNAEGKPEATGKIVLLSVGMSNTRLEFEVFAELARDEKGMNPRLVLVDGAQDGMPAARIQDAHSWGGARYWNEVDRRLRIARVTPAQVQVAWLKQADAMPRAPFPDHARTLQAELARTVRLMKERFPNLQMVYLSSRSYGGYSRMPLNPEPYAYESGFAVKWLIEQQLKGEKSLNHDPEKGKAQAPWLSWGPYLWANGTTKRSDGLRYEYTDFGRDGTHPSLYGCTKIAEQILRFFKTDATAKVWFLRARSGDTTSPQRDGKHRVPYSTKEK
jgi:hypothetical protein